MKIRFINARILTMKDGDEIFEGELWTDGNKISYVGPKKESSDNFDRVIDLNGNVIMPGFKNAHTHSSMTFLRSYADDLTLHDWLYNAVFPMEEKIDGDDMYHLAKVAIAEYLTSGITANFDMYFFPERVGEASIDCGFRTVLLGSVNNFKESVQKLEKYYHLLNNKSELLTYRIGFHAEYTTDREILVELSKLANSLKTPIYTHSSETENEVKGCIERHGVTPTVLFDQLGLYNYGGGAFHCVYMSDEDLEIFKKRGLYAVTCPGSNVKLASGIAPLCKMQEYGINIAMGTDGPASNNCLDMFREMHLTTALQKIATGDAAAMDAYSVLKMATVNGAHAMGLFDADVLDVGKLADLCVINLHRPNMQPINNIAKNIVYSGSKENVYLTMVNGKILYENGEFFIGEDIEKIYQKANEITSRVKNEIKK